jgi:hypothetical protein
VIDHMNWSGARKESSLKGVYFILFGELLNVIGLAVFECQLTGVDLELVRDGCFVDEILCRCWRAFGSNRREACCAARSRTSR